MCGRYVFYDTDELGNRYSIDIDLDISPNYNVAPTQTMPVITEDGLQLMRWGLIPVWAKDEKIGYKLINARSESLFEKPMWKGIVKKKRCLIPANGFYEWQKQEDGKHPFYIHPNDEEIFSFAGIWETWSHDGKDWNTYSIITTEPNKEMEKIHNRMPVILHRDDESQWLSAADQSEIEALLLPYQDNGLDIFEVSKDVNVVATNNKALIGPLSSK